MTLGCGPFQRMVFARSFPETMKAMRRVVREPSSLVEFSPLQISFASVVRHQYYTPKKQPSINKRLAHCPNTLLYMYGEVLVEVTTYLRRNLYKCVFDFKMKTRKAMDSTLTVQHTNTDCDVTLWAKVDMLVHDHLYCISARLTNLNNTIASIMLAVATLAKYAFINGTFVSRGTAMCINCSFLGASQTYQAR